MSTKINVRSPYFIEFTEPAQAFGTFICSTANLQNMSISSTGVITNPTISRGTIIQQSPTQFSPNTGSATISRTVTYTIQIPQEYSNSNEGTIDCPVSFDQPFVTSLEDPNTNSNCPTFAGTIPTTTNVSSTTINLSTFFTSGSTSNISSYEVIKLTTSPITFQLSGTVPNQTLTIQDNGSNCSDADFVVAAKNDVDSCAARSNVFQFIAPCVEAYDCDDANLTDGSIDQDGTIHKSAFSRGTINDIIFSGSSVLSSLNVGANNTGSDRSITLTYRMNIPTGFSNSGTFDCDITYIQPSVQTLPTFDCAEANIQGVVITEEGNIGISSFNGTLVSYSPQFFDEVSVSTSRTITGIFRAPSTNYSNSNQEISCDVTVEQPPKLVCGTTGAYITQQGVFTSFFGGGNGFCGSFEPVNFFITIDKTITQINNKDIMYAKICRYGTPLRGGNLYYGYPASDPNSNVGEINALYYMIRISDDGIVTDIAQAQCIGGSEVNASSIV